VSGSSEIKLAFRPGSGFSTGGFDYFGRLEALREHLAELFGCDVGLVEEPITRSRLKRIIAGEASVPSSHRAVRFRDIMDNIQLIRGYLTGMDQIALDADRRT
jgi:hypothetical protein